MRMSLKVKSGDLKIFLKGGDGLSEERRARAFAEMAKQEIDLIDRVNDGLMGRDVKYKTFVDGRETRNLYTAKTTSRIEAEWQLGLGVVDWIWDLLGKVGPVKRGKYRDTRMMFADGRRVMFPKDAMGAKEVMFAPTVPYARKIERGAKGYTPGAVYETVAAMAKSRFNNIVQVKFTYAEPPTTSTELDTWAMNNAAHTTKTAKKRAGKYARNRRNPAIIVYF